MVTGDSPDSERDDAHFAAQPAIREILASLGLSSSRLTWIASYSHSAWMTDEVVVRYRTFGPTGRLRHEAAVAALLPAEVLYPTVVAHGCDGENDWLVTERIPGESLYAMWPRLSVRAREAATHEMAIAVRALHCSPAQHLQPPCLYGGASVVARAKFIDTLSDVVRSAAHAAEPADVRRCLELLDSCRGAIDDLPTVMAHHDLNLSQCIWRDGHVVGLVDLEMSHANSADWDLVELLDMCADPARRANTAAAGAHLLRPSSNAWPTGSRRPIQRRSSTPRSPAPPRPRPRPPTRQTRPGTGPTQDRVDARARHVVRTSSPKVSVATPRRCRWPAHGVQRRTLASARTPGTMRTVTEPVPHVDVCDCPER
jgi:aminoglycoside phosphotransferase